MSCVGILLHHLYCLLCYARLKIKSDARTHIFATFSILEGSERSIVGADAPNSVICES